MMETFGKNRVRNPKYSVDIEFEIKKDTIFLDLLDKKKGRLLDCGCGDGRFAKIMSKAGFQVYACDFDKEFYKAEEIPFKKVDLNQKLPYKSDFFDVIILREVIEHIDNQASLFNELHRITKPGGFVLLETPNVHNWISKLIFLFSDHLNFFYGDYLKWIGHKHPLFTWNLARFSENKFKIEKIFFPHAIIPLLRIRLPLNSKFFGDSLVAKLRKIS